MRHTKGPWSVGVYKTTENFRRITQHTCVCDPVTYALIAVCGPADDQQSQVDATLISTAPELLEAIRKLVGAGEDLTLYNDPAMPLHEEKVRCFKIAMQNAKAVWAKAEGRSDNHER